MISLLFVDSNAAYIEQLRDYIEHEAGFAFDSADTVTQAIKKVTHSRYDMILSEYQLDEGTGIDLLQKIRSLGYEMPFVFFSREMPENLPLLAINNGANYCLAKHEDTSAQCRELVSIVQKLGDRWREAERVRTDHQIMNALLMATPVGICVIRDHIITWTNAKMHHMLGYEEGSLIGRDPLILMPDEDEHRRIDQGLFGEHDENGWGSANAQLKRKDGSFMSCYLMARPVDPADPSMGSMIIGQDTTEYKRLHQLLRNSQTIYQDLMANAKAIILRVDTQGIVRFINTFGESFFLYRAEELVGKPIVGTILPRKSRSGRDLSLMVMDVMESPEDYEVNVNENMKKNGERVWIAWINKPIRDERGHLVEILSIGSDISDQTITVRDGQVSVAPWKWRILEDTDIEGEVFDAVYGVSLEISREGREGKPVGTTFLVGDSRQVMAKSRQLILNPFEGHAVDVRMVTNPELRETIKEMSQLDGAFVITGTGAIEAAGRYITIDTSRTSIPEGMGTRHASVAAITQATRSVGIVISQSGGRISIFKCGKLVKVIGLSG